MKILTRIRKFFYLTPRDLYPEAPTVEEIAAIMNSPPQTKKQRPMPFADTMARILKKERSPAAPRN